MKPVFFLFPLLIGSAFSAFAAAPEAPTGLEASDNSYNNRIALSWEHVQGATVYRVFRSTESDPATALSIGITEGLTFNDPAQIGEAFFYWVRAESSNGASPLSQPDRGAAGPPGSLPFPLPIGLPGLTLPPVVLPSTNPVTAAKIYLGKALFWDEQLSSTRTVACGTCHRFRSGGTDPRSSKDTAAATHPGVDGRLGTDDDISGSLGVPSTRSDGSYQWNAQFGLGPQVTERRASSIFDAAGATSGVLWDGKPGFRYTDPDTGKVLFSSGASLEAQAMLPLLNPVEMAHDGRTTGDVVARIAQSKPLALASAIPAALAKWIGPRTYPDLFEEAFGSRDITAAKISMAIASYERSLVPDRAPIDGQLSGALARGATVIGQNTCFLCHRTTAIGDGGFRATGVRPITEDAGRGKVTGAAIDMGTFRSPGLRNAGLKNGFQHTGRFASLEEVIEFYNRGGDFKDAPAFIPTAVRPLNLTPQQKSDLAAFIRFGMLDQRAARESGPVFDRPLLYSESARVPVLVGAGQAPSGSVPEIIAIEPPYARNPSFTIALSNVPPNAQAVLAIDRSDAISTSPLPTSASFLLRELRTSGDNEGHGFASVTMPIPADAAGQTLYARWYVVANGQLSVSRAARFTVFAPQPTAETFLSLSAASLTKGTVAPDSIVSGFAADLAASTIIAPAGPLPTTLGGLRISITDSTGAVLDAPLFFVSAAQINYLVPAATAIGEATVRVTRNGAEIAAGKLHIAAVAPALFSANADGRDAASALVQRGANVNGIIQFDTDLQRWMPQPQNIAGQDAFLLLFGTGLRAGQAPVTALIGGEPVEVLFAGAQGQFPGLDQVNLKLPLSLSGKGEVDVILWVDGKRSNPVRISVQ